MQRLHAGLAFAAPNRAAFQPHKPAAGEAFFMIHLRIHHLEAIRFKFAEFCERLSGFDRFSTACV